MGFFYYHPILFDRWSACCDHNYTLSLNLLTGLLSEGLCSPARLNLIGDLGGRSSRDRTYKPVRISLHKALAKRGLIILFQHFLQILTSITFLHLSYIFGRSCCYYNSTFVPTFWAKINYPIGGLNHI